MEKTSKMKMPDDSLLEPLKKDVRIQRFLKEHHKEESFLRDHASYFFMWQETLDTCKNCLGLAQCRQPLVGKVKTLAFNENGDLIQNFVSCKYQKKIDDAHGHMQYFRLMHMDPKDLEINLEDLADGQSMQYLLGYKSIYESLSDTKGIYLYGQPGVGKTYLCLGLANYYAKKKKSVSFVHVPTLISDLKQAMYDTDYRQRQMNALKFSEVVILDDIGAEAVSAWTRDEILLPILDHRMSHHKKTYFTSNYALEELEKQYILRGEANSKVSALRIMERIKALSTVCKLSGESRR